MRYIDMQENRKHGTAEFPLVYYVEVQSRYYTVCLTIGMQNVS